MAGRWRPPGPPCQAKRVNERLKPAGLKPCQAGGGGGGGGGCGGVPGPPVFYARGHLANNYKNFYTLKILNILWESFSFRALLYLYLYFYFYFGGAGGVCKYFYSCAFSDRS